MSSTYGYTRVSTADQADDRTSLEDQERRILGTAMARGGTVTRMFTDPGVSGSIPLGKRPAGAMLMAALKPGDTVIAAKMDRVFRSAQDAINTAEHLRRAGVALILADMGPDPVTENGAAKLFFTMLAAIAEFERSRIAERMADGKAGKVRGGGFAGGQPPYGTRVVGVGRDARLVPDDAEVATAERIRALREQGRSLRAVAAELEAEGVRGRTGAPLSAEQVRRVLLDTPARLT